MGSYSPRSCGGSSQARIDLPCLPPRNAMLALTNRRARAIQWRQSCIWLALCDRFLCHNSYDEAVAYVPRIQPVSVALAAAPARPLPGGGSHRDGQTRSSQLLSFDTTALVFSACMWRCNCRRSRPVSSVPRGREIRYHDP